MASTIGSPRVLIYFGCASIPTRDGSRFLEDGRPEVVRRSPSAVNRRVAAQAALIGEAPPCESRRHVSRGPARTRRVGPREVDQWISIGATAPRAKNTSRSSTTAIISVVGNPPANLTALIGAVRGSGDGGASTNRRTVARTSFSPTCGPRWDTTLRTRRTRARPPRQTTPPIGCRRSGRCCATRGAICSARGRGEEVRRTVTF